MQSHWQKQPKLWTIHLENKKNVLSNQSESNHLKICWGIFSKLWISFDRDELSIKLGEQKQLVLQVNCPKIKYLEQALITLTLEAPNRGQLEIAIKSPKGMPF
jgi:hypothetical protein